MNIPFSFTFSGTGTEYGILWNPWNAAEPATAVANDILKNLVDPLIVGLVPPNGPFWVDDFTIMTDSTGDCKVSIGYYDVTAAAFVQLYSVVTTDVAGSGVAHGKMKTGLRVPASATAIPCVRYDGANGSTLTGDLGLFVPASYAATGASVGTFEILLDEAGVPLKDETGNLLYAG